MKGRMMKEGRRMRVAAVIAAAALALSGCGGASSSGTASSAASDVSKEASSTTSAREDSSSAAESTSSTASAESGTESSETESKEKSGAAGLSDNIAELLAVKPDAEGQMASTVFDGETTVLDDKYRTTYEIFPYSFRDSNGDGVGDLKGITEALDYLNDGDDSTTTDLGVNALWLTPIHPSTTYHKYDVKDYTAIEEEFGTMEDFDALLAACHERGIRLIMDLVINHSSVEHPWFTEAAKYIADLEEGAEPSAEECPYFAYYNFSRDKQEGYAQLNLSKYASGTPNPDTWYYEARFWDGMPDLNLDNEAVKAEITEIAKFWLDKGVDGFRLDAVLFYYTNSNDSNIQFLTWFNEMVKGINPDAYIVGECWAGKSVYADYYKSGMDSLFDFAFAGSDGGIAKFINGGFGADVVVDSLAGEQDQFAENGPAYVNAPFFTNHDTARGAGYFAGDDGSKYKMAQALNLLTTGNAFLYYGEELGMRGSGKDENKRAPMYWTDEELDCMCDGPAAMDDFEMKYPSLETQTADADSILSFVRSLIRVRNTYPAIGRGKVVKADGICAGRIAAFAKTMEGSNAKAVDELGGVYDTLRAAEKEAVSAEVLAALDAAEDVFIVMNFDDEEASVDLAASETANGFRTVGAVLTAAGGEALLEGDSVTLPPYSAMILTK